MAMDQSLLGKQVQVRVGELELVGTETIMMHHSLMELMEQMTKVIKIEFDQVNTLVEKKSWIWQRSMIRLNRCRNRKFKGKQKRWRLKRG